MGTAEQNRAPGQRGQRAGIPFAAGRTTGTRVVSDVGRDSPRRPQVVETRGNGDLECLWFRVQSQASATNTLHPTINAGLGPDWILGFLLLPGADLSGPWRLTGSDCSSLARRAPSSLAPQS